MQMWGFLPELEEPCSYQSSSLCVEVGFTTFILHLRKLKLRKIKKLIQNQLVQMKSQVLASYHSVVFILGKYLSLFRFWCIFC